VRRKGKKSAWTTKAKQLKQQEEEKQQQEQLLLLQQQEAQIKLEEAEKANARGMSGSSFMETKEEILAKKVQLENRIRATFGASGDHDAVERIALGEAAHPAHSATHANGIHNARVYRNHRKGRRDALETTKDTGGKKRS